MLFQCVSLLHRGCGTWEGGSTEHTHTASSAEENEPPIMFCSYFTTIHKAEQSGRREGPGCLAAIIILQAARWGTEGGSVSSE